MPYRVAIIGAGSAGSAWRSRSGRPALTSSSCWTAPTTSAERGGITAIPAWAATWRRTCTRSRSGLALKPALPAPRGDPGLPARAGRRGRPGPASAVRLRGGGGRVRRASRGLEPGRRRWQRVQANTVVCAVGQLGRPRGPTSPARTVRRAPLAFRPLGPRRRPDRPAGGGGRHRGQRHPVRPEIAKVAGHVDVYQRCAPYVLPKADRPYRDAEQALYDRVPAVRKATGCACSCRRAAH